jgi:hypothetical protein
MTETDISKVLIEGDYATIMGVKYKRAEEPKSPVEEAYKEWMGEYPPTTPSVSNTDDIRWRAFQMGWMKAQVPVEEPYKNVKAYWDKKDNPKPMDEVVDGLVKKYQAQKLYKRLFEVGYGSEDCEMILSVVEDWLPKEQISAGSQNVNTELLVEGFNDAIQKMKEMLR